MADALNVMPEPADPAMGMRDAPKAAGAPGDVVVGTCRPTVTERAMCRCPPN